MGSLERATDPVLSLKGVTCTHGGGWATIALRGIIGDFPDSDTGCTDGETGKFIQS